MAGKIKSGLALSKQSWAALGKNWQLIVFPIISGIAMLVVTILFFVPEAFALQPILATEEPAAGQWLTVFVIFFLYYLVASFVVTFSNTALVGATLKMLRGEPATVADGIRVAMSRLGKIVVYSLISATVGVIARGITQSGRQSDNAIIAILTAILGGLIQGAWSLMVFFAIPVMIVENVGVRDSLKRSLELFKRTWGEGFVGSTAIGGISCLAMLVVLLAGGGIIAAGVLADVLALVTVGAVLLILGLVLISLLNGAVNGIFQASMYNYATTGDAGPFIDSDLAREAFQS